MVSIIFFLHLGTFPCRNINVITKLLCFLSYDSMTELFNCNAAPWTHLYVKYCTGETAPPIHRNNTHMPMDRHMDTPNYVQVCTHRHTVLHICTYTHIHSLVHSMHILVHSMHSMHMDCAHVHMHSNPLVHSYVHRHSRIPNCIYRHSHMHTWIPYTCICNCISIGMYICLCILRHSPVQYVKVHAYKYTQLYPNSFRVLGSDKM